MSLPSESGHALESLIGACSYRRTGTHFAGTCASRRPRYCRIRGIWCREPALPAFAAGNAAIRGSSIVRADVIPIALTRPDGVRRLPRRGQTRSWKMHPGETVPRLRRRRPAFRAVAALTALAVAAASIPAHAQAPPAAGLPIIRDAEIEQLLRDYTAPILRVAGLAQQNVQIVIINERSFNAFVVDGRRIFVNVGALMESKTPNEIIGVLAHETGHIAGGHLSRLRDELANAQTAAIIALLLGLGAVAAGARAGAGSGVGNLGAAALQAPQGVIQRSLLADVRAQEEQADKAGVKFLNATGRSPRGMYETFKRFADKIQFSVRYIDPYLQTHPMPAERVEALAEIAKSSPNWDKKDPPELQQRHDMMRAKLSGFIERPDTVANRYPPSDTSMPARYA